MTVTKEMIEAALRNYNESASDGDTQRASIVAALEGALDAAPTTAGQRVVDRSVQLLNAENTIEEAVAHDKWVGAVRAYQGKG